MLPAQQRRTLTAVKGFCFNRSGTLLRRAFSVVGWVFPPIGPILFQSRSGCFWRRAALHPIGPPPRPHPNAAVPAVPWALLHPRATRFPGLALRFPVGTAFAGEGHSFYPRRGKNAYQLLVTVFFFCTQTRLPFASVHPHTCHSRQCPSPHLPSPSALVRMHFCVRLRGSIPPAARQAAPAPESAGRPPTPSRLWPLCICSAAAALLCLRPAAGAALWSVGSAAVAPTPTEALHVGPHAVPLHRVLTGATLRGWGEVLGKQTPMK